MEPVLVGAPVPFVVAQILEPLGVVVKQADRHDLNARTFGTSTAPDTTLIVWFALIGPFTVAFVRIVGKLIG